MGFNSDFKGLIGGEMRGRCDVESGVITSKSEHVKGSCCCWSSGGGGGGEGCEETARNNHSVNYSTRYNKGFE